MQDVEFIKGKLLRFDAITEEDIQSIWSCSGDDYLKFDANGDAFELSTITCDSPRYQKMIFRFRQTGDAIMFWSGLDPICRRQLQEHFGCYEGDLAQLQIHSQQAPRLDFFVWLANTHCQWDNGHLLKSPIKHFFECSESQQITYLVEYEKLMAPYAKVNSIFDQGLAESMLKSLIAKLNEVKKDFNWKPAHDLALSRALSTLETIKLKRSEKSLVILDLNEVLLDRLYVDDPKAKPDCDHFVGKFAVWLRPGARDFLDHILKDHYVAVWSSAKAYNVDQMLDVLFTPNQRRELLFVWAQEECTAHATPVDSKHKGRPVFLKDLRKVWESRPEFDETNTFLIDNSIEKCEENPEKCVKLAKTWTRDLKESSALELLELLK